MTTQTQHAGPDERSELRASLVRVTQLLKDRDTLGASLALADVEKLIDALLTDSKAGGEVFGWFMRLGTYAPVFLEQSNPPHPFTFEEAVAEGWRPLYTHPQQQAAQAAVSQWHPIETAPKDGTVILVADTFTYRRDPDKKPHHVYRAVRWDEESYGWEIYNDGEIIDQDGPTFWMPLPAEPGSMLSAAPVAAPVEQKGEAHAPQ